MSFPSTQLYPSNTLFPSTPGRVLYVDQDLSVELKQVAYSGVTAAVRVTGNPVATVLGAAVTVVDLGGTAATPGS